MTINALVMITADPSAIADLGPRLTEIPGVTEAHSVAGGDCDLVAMVRVDDHEGVAVVVTESISRLPGIRATSTLIAFRSYSAETLDAAFDGMGD